MAKHTTLLLIAGLGLAAGSYYLYYRQESQQAQSVATTVGTETGIGIGLTVITDTLGGLFGPN